MTRLKLMPLEPSNEPRRPRAAQYLRMSTDMQTYSLESQSTAIAQFAEREGLDITHTYADPGRSGLTLRGRPALQALLEDVENGADFEFLLVYDVSRWGRFQDVDESAFYEFRCRRAGIHVVYCAEPFDNDGSPMGAVLKSIKRAMAGEFSRELSVKISRAQRGLSQRGFWQGAPAGFGMMRQVIDGAGGSKGVLASGEYKFLRQDRVRLVAGDPQEVETVRYIFRLYTKERLDRAAIARRLNAEAVPRRFGRAGGPKRGGGPWSPGGVRIILRNAKYAGHYVYGQKTSLLGSPSRPVPEERWVRARDAFEPIIDQATFDHAQRIMLARSGEMTDEQMLDRLRALLAQHGKITTVIVNADRETPSAPVYAVRFGGLLQAYERIGWKPRHNWEALARSNAVTGRRRAEFGVLKRAALAAGLPAPVFESRALRRRGETRSASRDRLARLASASEMTLSERTVPS